MKKLIRYILLFPLSICYGAMVSLRNLLYDFGILAAHEKKVALLSVGNLTVGGTGKTPHVEFLLENLQNELHLAVLSRGYKRKSKGFVLINPYSGVEDAGDEPLQIVRKFPHIPVAVCEKRSRGVDLILEQFPDTDLIILDDAFQHRSIKAGFQLLLTDYNRLHTRDSLLPGGNLRETVSGSKRASLIMVTKCPPKLSPIDQRIIELELKPQPYQEILFSRFRYEPLRSLFPDESPVNVEPNRLKEYSIVLATGIVTPRLIVHELQDKCKELIAVNFPDHHNFTRQNLNLLERKLTKVDNPNKIMVVTDKDAVRLINNSNLSDSLKKHIFVIPVKVELLNDQTTVFTKKIIDYVRENKRDC
ncbi:MAG: tetraacyldisaccharide 4'-kinase [Paludibacter sp.]|jgi:tetraacyldisaccharide 4'-kinase|nr:tetraacyldisaccharide 4'-kinase [Paludibacter sp.]